VCPRAPVPCALAGLGCHVVVARHELWAHVENCIHNQVKAWSFLGYFGCPGVYMSWQIVAASHAADLHALPKVLPKAGVGGAHGHPQH